jgi:hypothetical protein
MKGYWLVVLVIMVTLMYPVVAEKDMNSSSFKLIQDEASSGSFVEKENGSYQIKFEGIDDSVHLLTNNPYPRVIEVPISNDTFDRAYNKGSMNAVIKLQQADNTEQDTLIATLSEPVYDSGAGTLSYTAVPESSYEGTNLEPFVGDADPTIPEKFGEAVIYYDTGSSQVSQDNQDNFNCGEHYVDCYDEKTGHYYGSAEAPCYWCFTCNNNDSDDLSRCKGKYGESHEYSVRQRTDCHYK